MARKNTAGRPLAGRLLCTCGPRTARWPGFRTAGARSHVWAMAGPSPLRSTLDQHHRALGAGFVRASALGYAEVAEARGFEPRMGANPNRISSSDRGRSDRFKLDQRP
jgi:hypothetical protein